MTLLNKMVMNNHITELQANLIVNRAVDLYTRLIRNEGVLLSLSRINNDSTFKDFESLLNDLQRIIDACEDVIYFNKVPDNQELFYNLARLCGIVEHNLKIIRIFLN